MPMQAGGLAQEVLLIPYVGRKHSRPAPLGQRDGWVETASHLPATTGVEHRACDMGLGDTDQRQPAPPRWACDPTL